MSIGKRLSGSPLTSWNRREMVILFDYVPVRVNDIDKNFEVVGRRKKTTIGGPGGILSGKSTVTLTSTVRSSSWPPQATTKPNETVTTHAKQPYTLVFASVLIMIEQSPKDLRFGRASQIAVYCGTQPPSSSQKCCQNGLPTLSESTRKCRETHYLYTPQRFHFVDHARAPC